MRQEFFFFFKLQEREKEREKGMEKGMKEDWKGVKNKSVEGEADRHGG